jgi:hypothetical protein
LFAGLFVSANANADGPLPGNRGDQIRTSDYSVDLFQGPTLASARVTAMGGAYVGLAEGAEGIPFNPAAASWRFPQSTTKVDWDITGGITLPTSVRGTDFDNNGTSSFGKGIDDFLFASLGGYIQYGHVGLGLMVSAQQYSIALPATLRLAQPQAVGSASVTDKGTNEIDVRFYKLDPVISYGFLDDQLHVGVGARAIILQVAGSLADVITDPSNNVTGLKDDEKSTELFTNYAFGAQAGILWSPYDLPLRLGGAVRSPLAATEGKFGGGFAAQPNGDIKAGNSLYLPKRADLPWEIEVGGVVQLWERPLNIQWQDEDAVPVPDTERWRETSNGQIEPPYKGARKLLKQRYRDIPRQKVLLTSSATVSGPVANAVGVESMLTGKLERSGENVSLTVRGGAEAEVIPYWLVLRAGSYLEPSRFRFSGSRVHGTGGFQVRLFKWDAFGLADKQTIWRVSTAIDLARDYFAWSIGAGMFM